MLAPRCGVTVTFSCSTSLLSFGGGSSANTSSAAYQDIKKVSNIKNLSQGNGNCCSGSDPVILLM